VNEKIADLTNTTVTLLSDLPIHETLRIDEKIRSSGENMKESLEKNATKNMPPTDSAHRSGRGTTPTRECFIALLGHEECYEHICSTVQPSEVIEMLNKLYPITLPHLALKFSLFIKGEPVHRIWRANR
jgi:hypothetical protein